MPNKSLHVVLSEIRTSKCPYCAGGLVRVGDWLPTPLSATVLWARYWCRNCAKSNSLVVSGGLDKITDMAGVLNACT